MKNLSFWILFLLLTGAIVTCTPDNDDREPEKIISDWSGFYTDTISFSRIPDGYIYYNDSIVVKQIVRINDSTYKMCSADCQVGSDSIMFTIHYTNNITGMFIYAFLLNPYVGPIPPGSYAIPGSNYIYLNYRYITNNVGIGRILIERLKKI